VDGTNVSEKPATSFFKEWATSTLEMKTLGVSKMLIAIYQITQRIILAHGNIDTNSSKNLKSDTSICFTFEIIRSMNFN
jgi:hypothetical protein